MSFAKRIVISLAVVVGLFVVIGLLLPATYGSSRSTVIAAPAAVVFEQVNDLRKNQAWSPWLAADPSMEITYGAVTEGLDASYAWTSENSGSGSQTIIKSVPNERVVTALDFHEQGQAEAEFAFAPQGVGTRVTWSMRGDAGMNLPGRYFGLFMDKMIGPHFEDGLQRLKVVSESLAANPLPPQAPDEAADSDDLQEGDVIDGDVVAE